MKLGIVIVLLLAASLGSAFAQENRRIDSLLVPLPAPAPLPANISIYGPTLPKHDKSLMFDMNDYEKNNPARPFIPDLAAWQKDFIIRNGLNRIPANPTLENPNIINFLTKNPTAANQEIHMNYISSGRQAVGNTQLARMNVGMREIRFISFTDIGRTVEYYLKYKKLPDDPNAGKFRFNKPREKLFDIPLVFIHGDTVRSEE